MCISCGLYQETQSHLLHCPALGPKLNYLIDNSSLTEKDIYGSLEKQEKIMKVFSDLLEIRENLQKRHEEEGFSPIGGPSAQFSMAENLMQHR